MEALKRLRMLLTPLVMELKDRHTHTDLPDVCHKLALPGPSKEGEKAQKLRSSFEAVRDDDLSEVGRRLLSFYPPRPSIRNEIEEVMWSLQPHPEISRKTRRDVAQALENGTLYFHLDSFDTLLKRLWVVDDDPVANFLGGNSPLREDINRHVYRNPGDWSIEELFDNLGAFHCSDRRFALFIEGLSSSNIRPDETEQRKFVDLVNRPLTACGLELQETDSEGGYPVFTLVSLLSNPRRPKNLIFASSKKPDIRFIDAINNDIEIVSNVDEVLIFDHPIGNEGLRWVDLQNWWSDSNKISGDDAKTSLYRRLLRSLPENSPPQRLLFDAYYRGFKLSIPQMPALLPEVWLHWDPKTVKERGTNAPTRFRMDFLLLLPRGIRIVIEVDGKQHYSSATGLADTGLYARMMEADRDLKLSGYEVFRFGASELVPGSEEKVKAFFDRVFYRYSISL